MTERTFSGISPQSWADIQKAVSLQAGVPIEGDAGSASSHGIKFSWDYAAPSNLTVTINSVPWALSLVGLTEEAALGKFADWIQGVE